MDASRVYLAKFGKSRLYVLIMPSKGFKENRDSRIACMSRNSLLEQDTISDV